MAKNCKLFAKINFITNPQGIKGEWAICTRKFVRSCAQKSGMKNDKSRHDEACTKSSHYAAVWMASEMRNAFYWCVSWRRIFAEYRGK